TFPSFSIATDPTTGATFRSYYDLFTVGAGYLDIAAALASTDTSSKTAHSPAAVYDATTKTVSLVTDSSVMWGTSVAWGTSVVWGTNVAGTSVMWGTSVVWGTSDAEGFSVIWGTDTTCTSVIWGASADVSGENVLIYGEP